jgi:SAM-dependent methyltransferase
VKKLNFGCGTRFATGWTNLDFHGDGVNVVRANLLSGFPFSSGSFDAVYSSHVLEHFTPEQGCFLISEAYRVLRPEGILRTVVPDLEESCREYLRILAMDDSDQTKPSLYAWTKIELLDQLVRRSSEGYMGPFIDSVAKSGSRSLNDYVFTRVENCRTRNERGSSTLSRLRKITPGKLRNRLVYAYLGIVKRMVPQSLRAMIWTETSIGEKHQWMYDKYGLALLMKEVGFKKIQFVCFDESGIPGFRQDKLDENSDGTPYKRVSIYCEAIKR